MANPLKGEVELAVEGKTYTMCFTTNALAEIEAMADGKPIVAIVSDWQAAQTLGTLRLLLWGALRKHQPNLSLLDVGDLIDDLGAGRMEEVGTLIGKALRFRLSGSFDEPGAGDANPAE